MAPIHKEKSPSRTLKMMHASWGETILLKPVRQEARVEATGAEFLIVCERAKPGLDASDFDGTPVA